MHLVAFDICVVWLGRVFMHVHKEQFEANKQASERASTHTARTSTVLRYAMQYYAAMRCRSYGTDAKAATHARVETRATCVGTYVGEVLINDIKPTVTYG